MNKWKAGIAAWLVVLTALIGTACSVMETPDAPAPTRQSSAGTAAPKITEADDFPYSLDVDGDVVYPDSQWGFQLSLPREGIDDGMMSLFGEEGASEADEPWRYRLNIGFTLPAVEPDTQGSDDARAKPVREMARVTVFEAAELERLYAEGGTLEQIMGAGTSRDIGRNEEYAYVYTQLPEDAVGLLPGADIAAYRALYEKMPRVGDKLVFLKVVKPEQRLMPSFSATDLNGSRVTNALIMRKKLTVINLWGTYCVPCVEEMPELGKLAADMPEGTQLVGFVVDGDTQPEYAKQIVEATKADTYTHVIPDAALKQFCQSFSTVPTTIFMDSAGNYVGEPVVGSMSGERYRQTIENRLALLERQRSQGGPQ